MQGFVSVTCQRSASWFGERGLGVKSLEHARFCVEVVVNCGGRWFGERGLGVPWSLNKLFATLRETI